MVVDEFPSISTPFILNQIVGILNDGHDVHILSRIKGASEKIHSDIQDYDLLSKTTFFDVFETKRFSSRIKFFIKNISSLFKREGKYLWRSLNFLKYGKRAFALYLFYETKSVLKLQERKYDLIHCQFGPLGNLIMYQKKVQLLKGKLITNFRGYDITKNIFYEGPNYYDQLFEFGDWFITNCKFFEKTIIELGAPEKKTSVIYSGVQLEKFICTKENHKINDPLKLVTVARLSGKKGIKFILNALKMLNQQGIRFQYTIIGDGELKDDLIKQTQDLGLSKVVKFMGKQNHSFIIDELPKNDIFITHNITSDEGDQDAPVNTIKEAMLLNLPVIATFHGGIPELVKHLENGYLVHERNEKEILDAIIYLIQHQDQLDSWTKKANELVKAEFNWINLNDKLIHTYYKVLNI